MFIIGVESYNFLCCEIVLRLHLWCFMIDDVTYLNESKESALNLVLTLGRQEWGYTECCNKLFAVKQWGRLRPISFLFKHSKNSTTSAEDDQCSAHSSIDLLTY